MSRSKHTIPPRIRAPRRVRAPGEPRGHGDPSDQHALARALKEFGIRLEPRPEAPPPQGPATHFVGTRPLRGYPVPPSASKRAHPRSCPQPAPLPAVRVAPPREGFHHPASRADICRVLRFFGEVCTYGVRSVELVRGEGPEAGLQFGRLLVPGRILLYDQSLPPWVLPGRLPECEEERLCLAGAVVEAEGLQTVVVWPGETLGDFMLFDGLMHEIGHHLIQQYRGKRPARVLRTRDHEELALQFSRRCRQLYQEAHPSTP